MALWRETVLQELARSQLKFESNKGERMVCVNATEGIEEQRREIDEKLRIIAGSVPEFISYIDRSGRYRFVNKTYERWFKVSHDQIWGRRIEEVLSIEAATTAKPFLEDAFNGHSGHYETTLVSSDGLSHHLYVSYTPDFAEDKSVRGCVVIGHDITQSKQLEIAEKQAQEDLLFTIETMSEGYTAYDANYVLTGLNSETEKFLNQPREHLLGKTAQEIFPSPDRLKFQAHYDRIMATGEPERFEESYEGRVLQVHASRSRNGGVAAFFRDITEQVSARKRIEEGERQIQAYAEAMPLMAYIADTNGGIMYQNKRFYEYAGIDHESVSGWQWCGADVIHPDDKERTIEHWKRCLRSEEPFELEYRLRRYDGLYRWHLTKAIPQRDENGKVVRWYGTNADIHDQKQIQEDQGLRVRLTERLSGCEDLQKLAQTATEALATYLNCTRCFIASVDLSRGQACVYQDYAKERPSVQGTHQLMEWGAELVQNLKSGSVNWTADVRTDARYASLLERYLQAGTVSLIAVPICRTGRLVAFMSVSCETVRSWTSREIELTRLIAETTWNFFERVQLLSTIKAGAARSSFLAKASSALNSSLDAEKILRCLAQLSVPEIADWSSIQMLDSEGQLKSLAVSHRNPEKAKWGWEVQRKYPLDMNARSGPARVIRTGQPEMINDLTSELLTAGAQDEEHKRLLLELGFQSYICVPIKTRDRVIGTLGLTMTTDSSRRYLEEDLKLAEELGIRAGVAVDNARLYLESQNVNRVKDEFLATLSHELRTPINVIQGHSDILISEFSELNAEEIRESLEAIYRNTQLQTQIVSDLLDVSSIITGKIAYTPQVVSPQELVAAVVSTIRPTAAAKGITVTSDATEAPPQISADPVRLHQVLWNLAHNSVKFTSQGGRIEIKVFRQESICVFEVTDTGKGIEKDFLPLVFDRFRQEDSSMTRKYGGLGLGLSIVKSLVEIHGGSVEVSSPGKDRGSTFTVSLPLMTAYSYQAPEPSILPQVLTTRAEDDAKLGGVTILLIEDSPDNRVLVSRFLSKSGAKVVEADSAASARSLLEKTSPAVIVSDIGMPEENGYEFMRWFRAQQAVRGDFTPAIALTAYVRPEEKEEAFKAGFQAHVAKPVSATSLITEIRRLVPRG